MSVSTYAVSHMVAAILKPVDTAVPSGVTVCTSESASAPLSVPHMFWRASTLTVSTSDDVPAQFDCLIDNGSSLVLIQNSLVDDLSLHHHKLPELIETELAMQEGEDGYCLFVQIHEVMPLQFFW